MAKKIKIAVLMLLAYLIVFGIGFKSGAAYLRMQKKIEVEKIEIAIPYNTPLPDIYYVVEKTNKGGYSEVTFRKVDDHDDLIHMLKNEKLRPLLKLRDLEIYRESGERIY